MFGVGGGEILVILLVALIVLGPDKLPGAVRKAGQVMSEVRKVSDGFQAEMRTAMLDHDSSRRPQSPPARPAAPADDGQAARPDDAAGSAQVDAGLGDDELPEAGEPGDPPGTPGGDAGTPT